ncbi:T9SS type A sorting domain-containing protein [Flavobacterium dankookense]|uniref:Putative secreted protein (Por secretion system target) n=1 Tax=Flavobacterium dankookense TaxID=706186 RepID=A0A4R6QBH4_9FLAO|nr:T9SS type A sorting domain-containing protein [Flavobacterium dankookense]TDP59163.1 putative secreted protein (Por secretion system target) [Flavobacterium dankookense]
MKKLFYILILITGFANAQIVNIPDANFKQSLIENGVDSNSDGEIQETEALATLGLQIYSPQTISTEGISSFINLRNLTLEGMSNLQSLDLSNLSNLQSLTLDILPVLVDLNLPIQSSVTNMSLYDLPLLTSVGFDNLTSLIYLRIIRANNLSNIDLSGNINIETLTINYTASGGLVPPMNLNSLNLTGCTSLTYLEIANTTLSALDLSTCINLETLRYEDNQVANLSLTGLVNLQDAWVMSNSGSNTLQTLDVSECISLTSLRLDFNYQLHTIFMKNGANETINFYQTPNIQYICADESQIIAVQNKLNLAGLTQTVLSSYCTFTPGGNYNTIVGQVQFDEDNNGCDVNGAGLPNVRINIADPSLIGATFSNANGGYTFYSQALNHELFVATENPTWFTVSPELASVSFTDINNNQTLQNFCVTPNGVHPDLEIVITPINPARPGFDATYKIVYRNKGNQTLSQQYGINFFYNQNLMEYVSASVVPSQMVAGGISWDYANLQPFESREIVFTLNINAPTEDINPVNNGDVLTFTTSIMPQAGDENTGDNTFVLDQIVVGSYDPNDITCLEGDIVSPTEIGEYLHYNIRFENTGTASAENIVVKTEINPAEFDINTLQLLNASHAVDARIRGNIVEFIFKEIYLQTGGHGNVLLKVKTKPNLQIGDLVKNKANIYFDYNFPILTNDAETVFQSLSNPDFETDNSVKIYPNPSNAIVNIKSDFNIKSIQLYDVQGRILQTNIVEENTASLDIASKAKGIYFLKVITDRGIKLEKLVKE